MSSLPDHSTKSFTRLKRSVATIAATGVLVTAPALAAPAHGQTASVAAVPTATVYQLGDRTLRHGDEGSDVAELQKKLSVSATGFFGDVTRAEVKRLERKYNLKPNGIVSAKTLKYILMWVQAKKDAKAALPNVNSVAGSKDYARPYINKRYGWRSKQWKCLLPMWERESNWRYWVSNPNGKYHGIPQTSSAVWGPLGYTTKQYMNNANVQIKVGAHYIKGRYGNPCKAWAFWQNNHWY